MNRSEDGCRYEAAEQSLADDIDKLVDEIDKGAPESASGVVKSKEFHNWLCQRIAIVGMENASKVREFGVMLTYVLGCIRSKKIGKGDDGVVALYKDFRRWDREAFRKAKKKLDGAARLLNLPKGYFYETVKVKRTANEQGDETNLVEQPDLVNSTLDGVPRFIGESPELYNKRVPIESRIYDNSAMPVLVFADDYAWRGGGKGTYSNEVELAHQLFDAAAAKWIVEYIPKELKDRKKLLADLLSLCKIKRSPEKLASNIASKTKFARGSGVADTPVQFGQKTRKDEIRKAFSPDSLRRRLLEQYHDLMTRLPHDETSVRRNEDDGKSGGSQGESGTENAPNNNTSPP